MKKKTCPKCKFTSEYQFLKKYDENWQSNGYLKISKKREKMEKLGFFQNWYSDVNLHFRQVFFFMFIKNVDSLGDN